MEGKTMETRAMIAELAEELEHARQFDERQTVHGFDVDEVAL